MMMIRAAAPLVEYLRESSLRELAKWRSWHGEAA